MRLLSRLFPSGRADRKRRARLPLAIETLEERAVPASIGGTVFNDANADGSRQVGEGPRAGQTVFLDQNGNCLLDSNRLTVATSSAPLPTSGTNFSSLPVLGVAGSVTDVDVTLNITHPRAADLEAFLISPTGTRVRLFQNVPASGANFTGTILDDEAALSIRTDAAPFTGRFRPEQSLSAFASQALAGDWILEISDLVAGENGTLDSWSLTVTYTEASVVTDASGNYTFSGLTAGAYIVRESLPVGFVATAPVVGFESVTLASGQNVGGVLLGDAPGSAGTAAYSTSTSAVGENGGQATLTVLRSGSAIGAICIPFATGNGTATAPSDYLAVSGSLLIPSGQTQGTITVPIVSDAILEPNETLTVTLGTPTGGAALGFPSTHTLTIVEPAILQFSASSYSFAETAGRVTITVTRTGNTGRQVTVGYAASNGTAQAGEDYASVSGVLTFTVGATVRTFTIDLVEDMRFEPNETINLTLSNPGGIAGLGVPSTAVLTITDNDPRPLQVASFALTNTGFTVQFSQAIDPTVLNLYDAQSVLGPADVTFATAAGNLIRGSLLIDPTATRITFVQTSGVYLPTSAVGDVVRLRSAADGFRTPAGGLLDGDNDGLVELADDYLKTITASPSAFPPTVSVPNVMRGPGQPVDLPGGTVGLPLRISDGTDVRRIVVTLNYDPVLLSITDVGLGGGLPPGSTVSLSPADPDSLGQATITFDSPMSLGAGAFEFARLTARVPDAAPYGVKQLLDLTGLSINNGTVTALADSGIHVAGYLGDATGNARTSALDAQRAQRVAVGLDLGFTAWRWIDPAIVADINGDGRLSALDATRILQEAVGIDQVLIPNLPADPPIVPATGPDPLLFIPRGFRGRPGETLTVPVLLDRSQGLESAELALSYDPARLEVVDVRRGDRTADFDLFLVNHDAALGSLRVGVGRTAGPITNRGEGRIVEIAFRIRADAVPGRTIVNLRQRVGTMATQLNEGGLMLNPAPRDRAGDVLDGVIAIRRPARATAPPAELVDAVFAGWTPGEFLAQARRRRR